MSLFFVKILGYHFIISRNNMKIDLLSEFSKSENDNQNVFNILKMKQPKYLKNTVYRLKVYKIKS